MSLPPPLPVRRVGIVGLGDQGSPIARNVLSKGLPLAFHARRAEVRDTFAGLGAEPLSPVELARNSDVLLVVVVAAGQVEAVLIGDGMLAEMRPGSCVVIHSTIAPDACRRLADKAARYGVHLLDAPVSGGRARSNAGELTIMVGGTAEAFGAVKPVLDTYSILVERMGPIGSGQMTKIINNYFYAVHLATAAKEVELVRALGLDLTAAARVLPTCSGSSGAFAIQAAAGFEPTLHEKGATYAMQILGEVVDLARTLADEAGVDLSLIDAIARRGMADEAARDS